MATTQNTYTGNGTNKLFNITFPYLDTTDIDVFLNGTLQTVTTQYTFANATTIEFVTAPANGATVLLSRSTDDTALQATFFPGSSIKAADLNYNFDQVLYLAQETANIAQNQSTAGLQAQITTATNTANNAITIANAANTTANGIAGTANTALSNSSAAVSTANAASVTATNAETTANAISAVANAALPKAGGTMTGNLNVVSLNGGQLAGTRNRIINGSMDISQRGTAFSNAGGYTLDRWYINRTGGVTGVTAGQTYGAFSTKKNWAYVQRDSGNTLTAAAVMYQPIEGINCRDLAGTSVTVSFTLGTGGSLSSTTSNVQCSMSYQTTTTDIGLAGSWTPLSTTMFSVPSNTQPTRYTATFAIPSTATQLLPYLQFTFAGTAGADDRYYVTEIQLEPGTVATPFERRSYGAELALAYRYFQKRDFTANGWIVSATKSIGNIGFGTPFRASPSSATFNTGSIAYGPGGSQSITSMDAPAQMVADYFEAGFNIASGMTTNAGSSIRANVSISAEL